MLHKKLSDTPPTGDPLTLVFVPSLSALLAGLEKRKGAPLNEEEVFSIRDKAGVIAMRVPDANQLAESRGYIDLDPEHCWEQWQELRQTLSSGDADDQ